MEPEELADSLKRRGAAELVQPSEWGPGFELRHGAGELMNALLGAWRDEPGHDA